MTRNPKQHVVKKMIHKLGIGMGPAGKTMKVVSYVFLSFSFI
jgi:peptidyl-tRNA hydrolase